MDKTSALKGVHRTRIQLILAAALSIIMVGALLFYGYAKRKAIQDVTQNLEMVHKDRAHQMTNLVALYMEQGRRRVADQSFVQMIIPLTQIKPADLSGTQAQDLSKKLLQYLQEYRIEKNFLNSLVIGIDGTVLFSDIGDAYVGKDVTQVPSDSSALGESFMRVLLTHTEDIAAFAIDPVMHKEVLFVLIPVFNNGTMIAVLAQEVDEKRLYEIGDDYLGLGSTGDVLASEGEPGGIVILSRTRLTGKFPFKFFIPYIDGYYKKDAPLAPGTFGNTGSDIKPDYAGVLSVTAWDYMPYLDWGITATMPLAEVFGSLHSIRLICALSMLCALMLLIWLCMTCSWIERAYMYGKKLYANSWCYSLVRWGVQLALLIWFLLLIYAWHSDTVSYARNKQKVATQDVQYANRLMQDITSDINGLAQELAYDLGAGILHKEDLIVRLKRDFAAHPTLFGIAVAYEPYQYSADKRLYAPYVTKKGDATVVEYLENTFDYTESVTALTKKASQGINWYTQTLQEGKPVWFDPYSETAADNKFVNRLCVPFYDRADTDHKKPLGVITFIMYTHLFADISENIGLGNDTYSILIDKTGTLLDYPVDSYITEQRTLRDVALEQNSKELLALESSMLAGHNGTGSFTNLTTAQEVWTYFEHEPLTGWTIIGLVPSDTMALPLPLVRQHYFLILLSLAMLLVVLMLYYAASKRRLYFLIVLLLFFMGGLLYSIRSTVIYDNWDSQKIFDRITLNDFLSELDITSARLSQQPTIKIPTGVYLSVVDFITAYNVDVAGLLWQKYPKTMDKKLIQEPLFTDAITPPTMKKIYEVEQGDEIVIGWQFIVRLALNFKYGAYPFDVQVLPINMEHSNSDASITLIPSLDDYRRIKPHDLFGVDEGFQVPGFIADESFYTFVTNSNNTNYGLTKYQDIAAHPYLSYNLILTRSLLYDIIASFLPIFVVFLFLFALSWIGAKNWAPLPILSGYTGVLFATILLHRGLRERYQTSDILYIEYLFFMIYFAIIPMVFFLVYKEYSKKASPILTLFDLYNRYFWAIQLFILSIITFIVFYS